MFFQATGFVRFIAVHRPTGKVQFDNLGNDIRAYSLLLWTVIWEFWQFSGNETVFFMPDTKTRMSRPNRDTL